MQKAKIIEKIIEILDRDGELSGLTSCKVSQRGCAIIEDPDIPGRYICSVERHRSIAGCHYRRGVPMAAMQTYLQRFSYDPASDVLEEKADEHVAYNFDFDALADEHLDAFSLTVLKKRSWKRKRRILESTSKLEFETSSFQQACEKIEDFIREWNLDHLWLDLELLPSRIEELESSLGDAMVKQAFEKLKREWAEPELIEGP